MASGRRFRTANLKDDCTRECPAILADFSLPGRRVTLMLDDVARKRGYPDSLVVDNRSSVDGRSDLRSRRGQEAAKGPGVHRPPSSADRPSSVRKTLDPFPEGNAVSRPRRGKPMQNGSIESFNAGVPEAARRLGVGGPLPGRMPRSALVP